MENINKKRRMTVIVFLAVQLFVAGQLQAQSERFLWEVHSPDVNIMQKQMDSDGNIYISGTFEPMGMLAGRWICPADSSEEWLFASQGVFIAKFDTTGAMQWCRAAKDWKDGLGYHCGFSLRDNKIHFAFAYKSKNLLLPWDVYQANKHCWLYFFDTIYYGMIDGVVQPYGTLPYRCGDPNTYLVTFDLDGNRIDTKTAKLFIRRNTYLQDSRGYHYFIVSKPTYRSSPRDYIMLNDDTTAKFYYPVNDRDFYPHERDYRITPYLVRINPEWTDVKIFQLTDSLDGFRNSTGDSVFCVDDYGIIGYTYVSFTVDKEDLFYVTAELSGAKLGQTSLPLELKFNDGSSYLIAEEHGRVITFIMSFDTVGQVKWSRQFFCERHLDPEVGDDLTCVYYSGAVFVDSVNLYYIGNFFSSMRWCQAIMPNLTFDSPEPNVYFDKDHQDTLSFPNPKQFYVAPFVVYDKHSGEYLYHIPLEADSTGTQVGYGARPFVTDDYMMAVASNSWRNNCTYRYTRHTGELEVYDTITNTQGTVSNIGLMVNDMGFVEKWIDNGSDVLQSPNFYIPPNNASILFYYDSLLDKRRRLPQTVIPAIEENPICLKVYPNPATDIITVSAVSCFSQIELYDSEGRLLERRQVNPNLGLIRPIEMAQYSTTIDLRNRPRGLYYVRVQSVKGMSVCKIIKI